MRLNNGPRLAQLLQWRDRAGSGRFTLKEKTDLFHWMHLSETAAEFICKYYYGENLPTEEERSRAMKICSTVQHPLLWLMLNEPQWWKNHAPQIVRDYEKYVWANAREQAEPRIHEQPELCRSNPFCNTPEQLTKEQSLLYDIAKGPLITDQSGVLGSLKEHICKINPDSCICL